MLIESIAPIVCAEVGFLIRFNKHRWIFWGIMKIMTLVLCVSGCVNVWGYIRFTVSVASYKWMSCFVFESLKIVMPFERLIVIYVHLIEVILIDMAITINNIAIWIIFYNDTPIMCLIRSNSWIYHKLSVKSEIINQVGDRCSLVLMVDTDTRLISIP